MGTSYKYGREGPCSRELSLLTGFNVMVVGYHKRLQLSSVSNLELLGWSLIMTVSFTKVVRVAYHSSHSLDLLKFMRCSDSMLYSATDYLFACNGPSVVHIPSTSFRINIPSVQRRPVTFTLYEVHTRDLKAKVILH